jgi:hypothetical protein
MDYEASNESHQSASNVNTYVLALEHCALCRDSQCSFFKCDRFKRLISHALTCDKYKRERSCEFCRQLLSLCIYHAKRCTSRQCQVPFCSSIKVKLENLRAFNQQQQQTTTQANSIENTSNGSYRQQLVDTNDMNAIEKMLSSLVF